MTPEQPVVLPAKVVDRTTQLFVLAAVRNKTDAVTPAQFLEKIALGLFTTVTDGQGRVVVSTTEANGSVSFATPPGLGPAEVSAAAMTALEWLSFQPDPLNPVIFPRSSTRLRPSLARSRIC